MFFLLFMINLKHIYINWLAALNDNTYEKNILKKDIYKS